MSGRPQSAKSFFAINRKPESDRLLENADSFSVECENQTTGVVDRESVDVDAGTVTIEIPGRAPVVHKILNYSLDPRDSTDRFGNHGTEVELVIVEWSKDNRLGRIDVNQGAGNFSSHDGSGWNCTSPSYQ
jgi:hypothetical protein